MDDYDALTDILTTRVLIEVKYKLKLVRTYTDVFRMWLV